MNTQEAWSDRINQYYSGTTVAESIVSNRMYHDAVLERSKCKWYHYFKKKRLEKIIKNNEEFK